MQVRLRSRSEPDWASTGERDPPPSRASQMSVPPTHRLVSTLIPLPSLDDIPSRLHLSNFRARLFVDTPTPPSLTDVTTNASTYSGVRA